MLLPPALNIMALRIGTSEMGGLHLNRSQLGGTGGRFYFLQNATTYLKSLSLCFWAVDCTPGLLSALLTLHSCRVSPYGGG